MENALVNGANALTGGFTNNGQAGTGVASPTTSPDSLAQPRLGYSPGLHEAGVPGGLILDLALGNKNFADLSNALSTSYSAFLGPTGPTADASAAPAADPNAGPSPDWWANPGVWFNGTGQAIDAQGYPVSDATVPDWAGGGFDTPEQFYQQAQSFEDPDVRRTWEANLRSAYGERQNYETAVLDPLLARSQPDYNYVTELQRSAANNQIAQQVAQSQAGLQAFAAGRGTGSGSASGGALAANQAYGSIAGLQLGASIDQANQGYRNSALELYGALGSIQPTDYFTGLDADRSSVQAQRDQARADQALLEFNRASETNIFDFASLANAFKGTGVFDALLPNSNETPWHQNSGLGLGGPGT